MSQEGQSELKATVYDLSVRIVQLKAQRKGVVDLFATQKKR